MPTLVIVGARDPLVRIDREHVLAELPQVVAVKVPGAHALNYSAPELIAELSTRTLAMSRWQRRLASLWTVEVEEEGATHTPTTYAGHVTVRRNAVRRPQLRPSTAPEHDRMMSRTIGRLVEICGIGAVALVTYFVMPLDSWIGQLLAALVVLAGAVLLVPLSLRQAREVLVSDHPVLVASQSLFTAVALLIVSFSSVYYVLGTQHSGQIDGISTKLDAVYFTVTILATVGFGDITAAGQGARAIVTAHMIVNFVLVAVAVRVVFWALNQRRDIARSVPTAPPTSGD